MAIKVLATGDSLFTADFPEEYILASLVQQTGLISQMGSLANVCINGILVGMLHHREEVILHRFGNALQEVRDENKAEIRSGKLLPDRSPVLRDILVLLPGFRAGHINNHPVI